MVNLIISDLRGVFKEENQSENNHGQRDFASDKNSDTVTIDAVVATLKAMMVGVDIMDALDAGNAVLIAAGRAPLSIDDVLAKMEDIRYGQTG